MMTKEQAAETWCPMVRISRREEERAHANAAPVIHIVAGCNTDALGGIRVPASCRCIADKCAMWRWGKFTPIEQPCLVDDSSFGPGGKRITTKTVQVPVAGFCGLAGVSR